jgi:hypothetical protein
VANHDEEGSSSPKCWNFGDRQIISFLALQALILGAIPKHNLSNLAFGCEANWHSWCQVGLDESWKGIRLLSMKVCTFVDGGWFHEDGKWLRFSASAFSKLTKKALPSIGVVELFAQSVSVSINFYDVDDCWTTRNCLMPPSVLASTNASCIFSAVEKAGSGVQWVVSSSDNTGIHRCKHNRTALFVMGQCIECRVSGLNAGHDEIWWCTAYVVRASPSSEFKHKLIWIGLVSDTILYFSITASQHLFNIELSPSRFGGSPFIEYQF